MRKIGNEPALIALDWGTSSLRGFLMSGGGKVLETRSSPHGIQSLPVPGKAGFEQAFLDLCAGWLRDHPGLPVVAGGMVGSAQGWVEAPYVDCPADVLTLADKAASVRAPGGTTVHIAPGVIFNPVDAAPDIVRGEEIQIAGALARDPARFRTGHFVLPGTHSKWIRVVDGRIVAFTTYMTGELFAVLSRHSILGRLMPSGAGGEDAERRQEADAVFERGLAAIEAEGAELLHRLFTVRTLGLTGRIEPAYLGDYLSGLLIGQELHAALGDAAGRGEEGHPLFIIGEGRLSRRYVEALRFFGCPAAESLTNTAPEGLHHFAIAAGLVPALEDLANVR